MTDKEDMEHKSNGILLSKKETESFPARWVNLEFVIYREVTQKNKYVNAYTWNLEKQYRWFYLQKKNRDKDIENKKGSGGMNGEIALNIYPLPILCIK